MRAVTYSLSTSLDGFITAPDGGIDWGVPDEGLFRLAMDEVRGVGVHLMGRRLYETMLYWETVEEDTLDDLEREWITLWNPLPKIVFSRTLTAVQGEATRLASGSLAEEIERLRAEPGEGDIAIGGAALAAEAADLGLLDEYRVRVHPLLLGGGIPYFARDERRVDLELRETRVLGAVVYLRYGVVR